MNDNLTSPKLHGISLAHARLPELVKLAEAARPFFDWVEERAANLTGNNISLSENLMVMSESRVRELILDCYKAKDDTTRPALFDGIGRQYEHHKAVYYFFSWMLRDAPQQRLQPIITRIRRQSTTSEGMFETQASALAKLFIAYRSVLGTFDWLAVREIIVDRLEGSRRSIRGRQSEVVVRTALTAALQAAHETIGRYGRFDSIRVHDKELQIFGETFDVCVDLLKDGAVSERILIPVKTRETEGGGHAHLFTRDIDVAMSAARNAKDRDGIRYWLAAFIVAENWAVNQAAHVDEVCDFAIALTMNPTEFQTLDRERQTRLNSFIEDLLRGDLDPKASANPSGGPA